MREMDGTSHCLLRQQLGRTPPEHQRRRTAFVTTLTVGLLQESTSLLYWMTRSSVTATDTSLALG